MFMGIRGTVSSCGTVTRSAPAGRRPPKPSLQIHLFMKKLDSESAKSDVKMTADKIRKLVANFLKELPST